MPQSAVVTRDGHDYVYRLAANQQVVQTAVTLGRRVGAEVELVGDADPLMDVVDQGTGFLADGDTVRVVLAGPPRP